MENEEEEEKENSFLKMPLCKIISCQKTSLPHHRYLFFLTVSITACWYTTKMFTKAVYCCQRVEFSFTFYQFCRGTSQNPSFQFQHSFNFECIAIHSKWIEKIKMLHAARMQQQQTQQSHLTTWLLDFVCCWVRV